MGSIVDIFNWFVNNWDQVVVAITSVIGTASIIVKLTPTLKDDDFLKAVIKFIGKWIALDKYGPKGE